MQKHTRQFLKDMGYGDQLGEDPSDSSSEEIDEDNETDSNEDQQDQSENSEDTDSNPDQEEEGDETQEQLASAQDIDPKETDEDAVLDESGSSLPQTLVRLSHADPDYKIFISKFDEEVLAEDLADDKELARLRAYLDQQLDQVKGAISRLANKLQRELQAQQNRSWKFDLEEGLLDSQDLHA